MLECLRANANIQTERRLLVLLTFYGIVITLLHIGEPSCGVEDISAVFFTTSKTDLQILCQKFRQRISVMEKCFQRIGILIHVFTEIL